jgi:hypothetical protein
VPRYTARPRAKIRCEWDDDVPLIPALDVPDHEEVFTGLLDSKGEEIWRAPREIGFGRAID